MKKKQLYFLKSQPWLSRTIHIVLLIALTSLVFSNTLDNAYHLDSIHRVKDNTEINTFWPPFRFFTDVRTGSTVPQIAEYRPMMPLTHAINSEIARATGTSKLSGFHVGNIAIHTGSVILVYYLFCLLLFNWGRAQDTGISVIHYRHQAFVAALIFAVHPIAGSAVNYIAGRDLLLMVFFFTASMLVYFRMRRTGDTVYGWLFSLLLLSLAILSKQAAIMGFGLVFLFEWILVGVKLWDWRLWARTALFAVPTAAYFLLRTLWIVQQNPSDGIRTLRGFNYPLTMLDAHFFYYFRNFVWPFEMRAMAKIQMVTSILEPSALIGLLFIITTLVVAWLFRNQRPVITFSILAYWLLFSLTSSIFPFGFVVTDYRQYLPMIFLSLTVTMLVFIANKKALSIVVSSVLIFYFSVSSYYINTHWKTEESFWKQSVTYGATALAHQNYGLAIVGQNPELAEFHYKEAIRKYPRHIYANINLGLLHIRMGKEAEGLARLREVAAINPKWALSHYWLSEGLKMADLEEEALKEVQIAADLDPRSLDYQYSAARALQQAGKAQEAIRYFKRVIDLNPNFRSTGFWLGFAYQKTNQSQQAIDAYFRFLENHPDYAQGHFNLAYELMRNNDCQTAIEHFNKVLYLRPNYREVHLHLSKCNQALGNEQLARQHASLYRSMK